jgi:hemerythrin superfamily protein
MPTRMTETPSASAYRATPGPRRSDGLIGVFSTLAEQHRQVAAMLAQLQQDPSSRAVQWPLVRRELVSHEHSEVRELYPVLRQYEATRALADHHDEEARELDALICRLDTLDVRSDAWGQVLEVLITTVLHHAMDEEEQKIFPAAQEVIGEARAIELDAKVLLAKQQLAEQQ